jgi:hypothetical protein
MSRKPKDRNESNVERKPINANESNNN